MSELRELRKGYKWGEWKLCCIRPAKASLGHEDHSIDEVQIDKDGTMWAGTGGYESQVNFCPFCDKKADTQIEN